MMMFRPYLIKVQFTSWGDNKHLLPHYNELTKTAPVRMARHRSKILYLKFTNKYLPGKQMPCDYAFRHAVPIEGLTKEENEWLMVDEGEDVHVMRVIMADLPPAMTMDMVKDVAEQDQVYKKLKKAVEEGRKPTDRDLVP